MLSSACFEHPSVHPQVDLYIEFYGIFSCIRISSLVDGKVCLTVVKHINQTAYTDA
jgi:hypothetical protein